MHTHARKIEQRFIQKQLSLIHAARRELLCAAVSAVMSGHLLSLSRLARALMGQSTQKAALKRVDRLMGNQRIAQEAQVVAAALLRAWCRKRTGSGKEFAQRWLLHLQCHSQAHTLHGE